MTSADHEGTPSGASPQDVTPQDAPEAAPEAGPGAEQAPAPAGAGPTEADELRQQVADRTADLQRLQAEYLNYKRRVDRDREVVRTAAASQVLGSLLPVLDDLGRADQHGELTGGFKAVADSLRTAVKNHGLEAYGVEGEPFDPQVHEALMHGYSEKVEAPTVDAVLQVGYRVGDRVLRPARVSVVEPGEDPDAGETQDVDEHAGDVTGEPHE